MTHVHDNRGFQDGCSVCLKAYLNRDYTDEAKARIDAATAEGLREFWSKPQ